MESPASSGYLRATRMTGGYLTAQGFKRKLAAFSMKSMTKYLSLLNMTGNGPL